MKKTVLFIEQLVMPVDDTDDQDINFYTGKLRKLDYVLNQLNLLDHPLQIKQICLDIAEVKKNLKLLQAQKKNLLSNQNPN